MHIPDLSQGIWNIYNNDKWVEHGRIVYILKFQDTCIFLTVTKEDALKTTWFQLRFDYKKMGRIEYSVFSSVCGKKIKSEWSRGAVFSKSNVIWKSWDRMWVVIGKGFERIWKVQKRFTYLDSPTSGGHAHAILLLQRSSLISCSLYQCLWSVGLWSLYTRQFGIFLNNTTLRAKGKRPLMKEFSTEFCL